MSSSAVGLRFNPAGLAANYLVVVSLACVVDAVFMATGLPFVGLILLTPPVGFLLLRYWRVAASDGVVLAAVGPFLAYLLFALLYGVTRGDDWRLVYEYLFSCMIFAVIAAHVVRSGDESVRRLTRLARDVLFIPAASTVLTPWYYPYLGRNVEQRYGGLLVNPNEAALMAVVLLNFVLYRPYRRLIPNGLAIATATAAVALSFSRIGFVLFFFSLVLFLLRRCRPLSVVIGCLVVVPLSFVFLSVSLEIFMRSDLATYLTPGQLVRIEEMRDFYSGHWYETEFRATNVGYRDVLWTRAIEIIVENFPHGAGLGSLHHIETGMVLAFTSDGSDWLGAHNLYLMIAGEAGVGVLVLLAACYGRLLAKSTFRTDRLSFSILSVMLAYWMTSHSGLGLRYEIMALAIAVGVLGRTREKRFRAGGRAAAGAPAAVERLGPAT